MTSFLSSSVELAAFAAEEMWSSHLLTFLNGQVFIALFIKTAHFNFSIALLSQGCPQRSLPPWLALRADGRVSERWWPVCQLVQHIKDLPIPQQTIRSQQTALSSRRGPLSGTGFGSLGTQWSWSWGPAFGKVSFQQ